MLRLNNVSYSYPHTKIARLSNISLHVKPGELLLCTGQSGCGKSTLMKVLNGLAPHYLKGRLEGQVTVNGRSTLETTPSELAVQVGSLFQEPERQFFALTVEDEIAIALQWRNWQPKDVALAVEKSAKHMDITHLLDQPIFGLSEGQKQKVALAGLLATRPKALLLDEPSANLDPESAAELACTLTTLKKEGLAILVTDHRLSWLKGAADSVFVLHEGKEVGKGSFAMLDNSSFRDQYGLRAAIGQDPRDTLPDKPIMPETSFFTCQNLSFTYGKNKQPTLKNVSLGFSPGEVVALLGENGVGKTTLARLFTGLEKASSGTVAVDGKEISKKKLPRFAQVVLQNAGHQLRMSTVVAELADAAFAVITNRQLRDEQVLKTLEEYGLQHLKDRHPQSLSGGEKQRLAVAAATIRSPKMLILDEPTSGLDGRNMLRIAKRVRRAAEQGTAVIVITHDLELIAESCTSKIVLQPTTNYMVNNSVNHP